MKTQYRSFFKAILLICSMIVIVILAGKTKIAWGEPNRVIAHGLVGGFPDPKARRTSLAFTDLPAAQVDPNDFKDGEFRRSMGGN